jgi:SnoaL-like domain
VNPTWDTSRFARTGAAEPEVSVKPRVRMGRPFVDGNRVAVEWWTTMIEEGEEVTLPGCLLLRFGSDGRCVELREHWNVESGRRELFANWGG